MASHWGISPRQSVLAECDRRSRSSVVDDCLAILQDHRVNDDFLFVLAGPSATTVLEGREGSPEGYWPKVWAARALLHVWDDRATFAIIDATTHESWRVREMSAKVVARHEVFGAIDAVVALLEDENVRVRSAASRAIARLARD